MRKSEIEKETKYEKWISDKLSRAFDLVWLLIKIGWVIILSPLLILAWIADKAKIKEMFEPLK